jgi:hypothetical protein
VFHSKKNAKSEIIYFYPCVAKNETTEFVTLIIYMVSQNMFTRNFISGSFSQKNEKCLTLTICLKKGEGGTV